MMRTEDHLGLPDLELLAIGSQSLSREQEDRVRDIRRHLDECRECAALAETHAALAASARGGGASDGACPAEELWLDLAAGLLGEAESAVLLEHAASCVKCAAELRTAMEDVGTSEVDEEVQHLESSGGAWQQNLAKRLSGAAGADAVDTRKVGKVLAFPQRRVWIGAVAAVLLLSVSVAFWWTHREPTDDALLAQAYDAQRLTELRLPGGSAVPMASVNRGTSHAGDSTQLLELELRAANHLRENPNDGYWHAALGRIALAKNDGETALVEFGIAKSQPGNEDRFNSDLADAHFEIGEATSNAIEYGTAIDLYGKAIQQLERTHDQKALALVYFNRALTWEQDGIYDNAAKDYEQALELEKNLGWRAEMERRLKVVRGIQKKSELNRSLNMDLSPAALLAEEEKDPPAAEQDYELYLDSATRGWIAERGRDPQTKAALEKLAETGLKHKDAWLRDMLAAPASEATDEAARHLGSSVTDSANGDADRALAEAETASRMYKEAHDGPGAMRADAEMVYALQRLGQAEKCLDGAEALTARNALDRYSWLHVYVLLEESSCHIDRGHNNESVRDMELALRVSRATALRLQELRTEGFMVTAYDTAGHTREAWQLAQASLKGCADQRGARMATFQFLHSMYLAANTEGLLWTAAGLADAASQASMFVSNLQIRAYSQEVAGAAATQIDHYGEADVAFAKASDVLATMPAGAGVKLYNADWDADRAALLARRGQLQPAVARMEQASLAVASTQNYGVREHDDTELAGLLLQAGDVQRALHYSFLATRDAEQALAMTSGEVQRLSWERGNGRGYRLLVGCLVAMGRKEEALRAWEWYRSAPFRSGPATAAVESDVPALPPLLSERRRGLTLVVARLEDRYVVWSVPAAADGAIKMVLVAEKPDQVELMVSTLAVLCSNRNSPPEEIQLVGAKLYQSLFGALDQEVRGSGLVQIDLDPALQRVPLAAMAQEDGKYLGIAHSLVLLPAWWILRPAPESSMPESPRALLVEGAGSVSASGGGGASTLAEEYLETGELAKLYPQARVVRGQSVPAVQKMLVSAELFHFNGHRVERNNEAGLLLAAPDEVFGASALQGVSLKRCRLAVLATCSSTVGTAYDVEDTGSLAHALLVAGAGNVMGTLWDVDSRSSRELMLDFYASLKESLAPADALRAAQQKLYGVPETAHPFFWAATEVFTQ